MLNDQAQLAIVYLHAYQVRRWAINWLAGCKQESKLANQQSFHYT